MGPSGGPETIINGLSDVKLVENDTSLDFEFFDLHRHSRRGALTDSISSQGQNFQKLIKEITEYSSAKYEYVEFAD